MVLRWSFVISILIAVFCNVGAVPSVYPLDGNGLGLAVDTNVGTIRGLRAEDGDYTMFLGIPYADVDSDNPFGPATPHPVFEDIFDAYNDSATCPQINMGTSSGTLDCLHLHVYVPSSASAQNRLPVLIWIHGGAFNLGSGNRYLVGPSFIVRHDVILVSLNYRLGIYGFMCLDTPEVPGNQGLKDQILALRWIKENIAAFGGDDTKITLAGNSAGAMSTDYHLHYGQEKLFHQTIHQSGVTSVPTSRTTSDPTVPLRLAEHLNYAPSDVTDALAFLASLDTNQVLQATNELGIHIRPCIEKKFDNVQNYITEYPVNIEVPRVKDIKVLIGFNNDEQYLGISNTNPDIFENTDYVNNWLDLTFNFDEQLFAEMREIVQHFYLADDDNNAEDRRPVIDMDADFLFNHPTIRNVKKFLDNGVQAMYLYLFSYNGGRNLGKERQNITSGGAVHQDELGYLFDVSYMEKPMDPTDELIVDRMTSLWTNFVKYGNPTPEVTELVPILWPPVTPNKWNFLEINTELQVSTRPFHDRMAFLDLFYKKNEQYQIGFNREQAPSSGRHVVLEISLPLLFVIKYFV